jgi:hypothetical protein
MMWHKTDHVNAFYEIPGLCARMLGKTGIDTPQRSTIVG